MINLKNTIPSQGSMFLDYLDVSSSIDRSHSDISSAFDSINALYSESSVVEDIILNKYLYLYSAAKQITPENAKSNFVTESFLAQNFADKTFPVDKKLNIDIQNGDLTLPIISTVNIPVGSIIIEADSNGGIGDSENNNSFSDISVITQNSSSSLFIYDKVVNSLSMSDLYLALTMKFKEPTMANGVYIQLYSDTGTDYPSIDLVQGSEDGETWFDIASSFKISELANINKADYYIRFQTRLTRFVRVKFSQGNYSPISTGFGTRYRYMIGLRSITAKQTVYDNFGEYISQPFSYKQALSYLNIATEDTGNVKYMVSATNGTVWQEITPGNRLYLYTQTLGLRDGTDINNIRLKIVMNKDSVSINKDIATEYAIINDSGSYFLQDVPINLSVKLGNHISYGNLQPYNIQLTDIKKIPSGILEDSEHIDHTAILYYIPYEEDMQDKMVLKLNGARVKNDQSIYSFLPHQDPSHSIIVFKNPDLTSTSGVLSIMYKELMFEDGEQSIGLPFNAFIINQDTLIVQELNNGVARTLKANEYTAEIDKVTIKDESFNPNYTYAVSYYPSFDVTYLVSETSDKNKVDIQGIKNVTNSKLSFVYYISSDSNAGELVYYTPISNQYVLEFR